MVHFSPNAVLEAKNTAGASPCGLREAEPGGDGFLNLLKSKVEEVNTLQNNADRLMKEGAVNGATNVHETMIQMEKADLSLRMMLRVRDKAISAYQEIMRMQF